MSTIWYGKDVDSLAELLKKALEDRDAQLVFTTSMHGTMRAGSKKVPQLRVPMAFSTDILEHEDGIPTGKTVFIGLMLIPTGLVKPEKLKELEEPIQDNESETAK